jgi:antitoxin component YwqK of YwqJK toxin-antitoxin module
MYKTLAFLIFFGTMVTSGFATGEKVYTKKYYSNGIVKAEGWQMGTTKTDYWIFYHSNGIVASRGHFRNNSKNGYWYFNDIRGHLEKEGHYVDGSAENWWIFYDFTNSKTLKLQYKNNLKNGYSLCYKNGMLTKAEKYTNDKKVGEWTSFLAFKHDNPEVSF